MSDHPGTNGNARWQTIAAWAIIGGALIAGYVRSEVKLAELNANQLRIETQMTRRGQLSYIREHELWKDNCALAVSVGKTPPPAPAEYLYEGGEK